MVVGEAPGKREDEEGKPFVGPSGELATAILSRANLRPDSVAWANVVSCFPNRTPTSDEVSKCSGNLAAQISIVHPNYVLLFGGVALSAWWNLRIGILRGQFWKGAVEGLDYRPWFLATWHPSAVLRNHTLEREMFADVLKFRIRAERADYIPPPYTCIECGGYANVWRNHKGEDVTNEPGELSDGSLGWCQKHDDFRMGKAGKGRVKEETVKKAGGVKKSRASSKKEAERAFKQLRMEG